MGCSSGGNTKTMFNGIGSDPTITYIINARQGLPGPDPSVKGLGRSNQAQPTSRLSSLTCGGRDVSSSQSREEAIDPADGGLRGPEAPFLLPRPPSNPLPPFDSLRSVSPHQSPLALSNSLYSDTCPVVCCSQCQNCMRVLRSNKSRSELAPINQITSSSDPLPVRGCPIASNAKVYLLILSFDLFYVKNSFFFF